MPSSHRCRFGSRHGGAAEACVPTAVVSSIIGPSLDIAAPGVVDLDICSSFVKSRHGGTSPGSGCVPWSRGGTVDDSEFDRFYAGSAARLVGQLHAMTGDRAEAQDCVQEAFVRAWAHRRRLDAVPEPGGLGAHHRVPDLRQQVAPRHLRAARPPTARSGAGPARRRPPRPRARRHRAGAQGRSARGSGRPSCCTTSATCRSTRSPRRQAFPSPPSRPGCSADGRRSRRCSRRPRTPRGPTMSEHRTLQTDPGGDWENRLRAGLHDLEHQVPGLPGPDAARRTHLRRRTALDRGLRARGGRRHRWHRAGAGPARHLGPGRADHDRAHGHRGTDAEHARRRPPRRRARRPRPGSSSRRPSRTGSCCRTRASTSQDSDVTDWAELPEAPIPVGRATSAAEHRPASTSCPPTTALDRAERT